MKRIASLLLFVTWALSSHAQMPNYGLDRSIGGPTSAPARPAKEKTAADYIQLSLDRMETELTLDALQKAVVKEALTDYYKVAMAIPSQDLPQEAKNEKLKGESAKMDKRINEILNPDQKTRYAEMKSKKAAKGKKKGKKSDKEIPDLTKLDSLMMAN